MIDLELYLEEYNDILNELYVGETPFIKDLIEEVSRARSPYVGKLKRPIKGNKDFIRIGDMLAEEFGFSSVTFMVPYDTSMNAFTYPITNSVDKSVIGVKPNFNKATGFKYESSGLSTIIAVTAGVWFNEEFSDREVVAAMLHEIGHSFVLQSERIVQMVEVIRVSLVTMMFYQIIIDICSLQVQKIPDDIKVIVNSSNSGKEIINQVARECANNPLFFGYNGIEAIKEFISGLISGFYKEISALVSGPANLLAIPTAIFNKLLSFLTKQETAVYRSQEYLSDSFATMYGLGPEISSFLAKIEYSPIASGSHIDKFISSTPIIGAINQSFKLPILMIMQGITTHPSTPARMNKIIEELNKELKNSDLHPKTKEAIRKNIVDLEKIKDEFLDTTKNKKYDAEMVKRTWMSFISNNGEIDNEIEVYYTDLNDRNSYAKEESALLESSTLNRLTFPYKIAKYNKDAGTSNVKDISDYIKRGGVNPGFRTLVEKTNDIEDLQYLRTDTRTLIPLLNTIKERIKLCNEVGETKQTKSYYKGIKKMYIDKGITEKDVQKAIDGTNESIALIGERIKELKGKNK